jgi:hypothetical protein
MGKRGPQPGTKYSRGKTRFSGSIGIRSDGQLVAAQRFNDHLEGVMSYIDQNIYPTYGPRAVPQRKVARLRAATEDVQHAVLEGILRYSLESHGPPQRPFYVVGRTGDGDDEAEEAEPPFAEEDEGEEADDEAESEEDLP